MSGVKGRSGGARPGAGRKREPANRTDQADPLQFLIGVMQGHIEANATQVKAAVAAVQYTHVKKGDGGKKDEQAEAAKKAAAKFNTPKPPLKLVSA